MDFAEELALVRSIQNNLGELERMSTLALNSKWLRRVGAYPPWLALALVLVSVNGCGPPEYDPDAAARSKAAHDAAVERFRRPLASNSTPVVEHKSVPADSPRRVALELKRKVIVAAGDTEGLFYRPQGVSIDESGRIYVLDSGNARIQVFAADGAYLRTVGNGPGSGPGQFAIAGSIGLGGGKLYYASHDRRLLSWDLRGQSLGTLRLRSRITEIDLTESGIVIAQWLESGRQLSVGRVDGRSLLPFVTREPYPRILVERGSFAAIVRYVAPPTVTFALDPAGTLYVTVSDRYQVLALDAATGEEKWLLKTDWEPIATTDSDWDEALKLVRERIPDVRRSEIHLPAHHPALSVDDGSWTVTANGAMEPIRVDRQGRLHVFPYVRNPEPGKLYPVDVYSSDGQLLGVYTMPRISWLAAAGDRVFGLEANSAEEKEVVSYEIIGY